MFCQTFALIPPTTLNLPPSTPHFAFFRLSISQTELSLEPLKSSLCNLANNGLATDKATNNTAILKLRLVIFITILFLALDSIFSDETLVGILTQMLIIC